MRRIVCAVCAHREALGFTVPEHPRSPHLKQLAKNIVRLRMKAGLTQEEAAERINVSARYFQSVEAGRYFPSIQVLVALRHVLDCTWDDLFAEIA